MSQIISAVLIVGGTGLLFGCILAVASVIFKVEGNEKAERILEVLPGANCGGCGYAGCSAYAEAAAEGKAPVNACSVGKAAVAEKIAEIMGGSVPDSEPMRAYVLCSGTCDVAKNKYEYAGIADCNAANMLAGGEKSCRFGCIGLGSCAAACQFGAITLKDGAAYVDAEKCVACGKCVEACPKNIITLVPQKAKYVVSCSSKERGAAVMAACKAGCVACGLCQKVCPSGAIKVEDNLAKIDYSLCTSCGLCAEKCPKKIIHKSGDTNSN